MAKCQKTLCPFLYISLSLLIRILLVSLRKTDLCETPLCLFVLLSLRHLEDLSDYSITFRCDMTSYRFFF